MRRTLLALVAMMCVTVVGPVAYGHGEKESTKPEQGAHLKKPPKHVYVNLTEAPSQDSSMTVTDGCRRDVVATVESVERTLHATLDAGEPGKWVVKYKIVSAEDGHPSRDDFSFHVGGRKDCTEEQAEDKEGEANGQGDDADPALGSGADNAGESSSSVPLFIGLGAVALIGAAFGIRLASKK